MNRGLISIFIILFGFVGCAQRSGEDIHEAIDLAQTLLTNEKCDEAIKVLEDVGPANSDAVYLQVLGSAYACKASVKTVNFIANDLPLVNSATFMNSISILSLSPEIVADSVPYTNLRRALGILQNTDKQTARLTKFGVRKSGDLGVEILLYSVIQLGKFLHFYGNVNSLGAKGGGTTNTNTCFLNYTYPPAISVVTSGGTGACTVSNNGHPNMTGAALARRLCEGSTLVANIVDVIKNIDLSGSPQLSDLEDINTTVDSYRADADAAGVGHLIDITSQSECETLIANPSEMNNMQLYYATVFEVGLQ
jgi:hypothetical protein